MSRAFTVLILIACGMLLLSSHQATAFTLEFGPVASAAPTVPGAENSDVPTPQLIRVAVDPSGVRLGTISPTNRYGTSEPSLQVQTPNPVPVTETTEPQRQASYQVEPSPTAHQLNGAELLLLRKTSVTAER